jgi:hypothetical protein
VSADHAVRGARRCHAVSWRRATIALMTDAGIKMLTCTSMVIRHQTGEAPSSRLGSRPTDAEGVRIAVTDFRVGFRCRTRRGPSGDVTAASSQPGDEAPRASQEGSWRGRGRISPKHGDCYFTSRLASVFGDRSTRASVTGSIDAVRSEPKSLMTAERMLHWAARTATRQRTV